jgi:hypothetical protein
MKKSPKFRFFQYTLKFKNIHTHTNEQEVLEKVEMEAKHKGYSIFINIDS